MVSHHPDKFGNHEHCSSGDITVLVYQSGDLARPRHQSIA